MSDGEWILVSCMKISGVDLRLHDHTHSSLGPRHVSSLSLTLAEGVKFTTWAVVLVVSSSPGLDDRVCGPTSTDIFNLIKHI